MPHFASPARDPSFFPTPPPRPISKGQCGLKDPLGPRSGVPLDLGQHWPPCVVRTHLVSSGWWWLPVLGDHRMSWAQGPPEGLWLRRREALIIGREKAEMRCQRQNWLGHLPWASGRPHPPAVAAAPAHAHALPESPPHPHGSAAWDRAGEAAGAKARVLVPTLLSLVFDASHHGPQFPQLGNGNYNSYFTSVL